MSTNTPGLPNPFCFRCTRSAACPVHAAMDPKAPQPHPHCYSCNAGAVCSFHALPAQQQAMALAREGKPMRRRTKPKPQDGFTDPNNSSDYNPFHKDEGELLREKQLKELAKEKEKP